MSEDQANPFAPNTEDMDGPYWDPWDAMDIHCGGYNSAVDQQAITLLKAIWEGAKQGRAGGEYGNFVTRLAQTTGLTEEHVELWQYLFCSAGWLDYGTSPRGAFPDHSIDFAALIAAWEGYYRHQWKEEFEPA